MTKPRYKRGRVVRDISKVVRLLARGQRFYWAHDPRPKAPTILESMTLRTLRLAAEGGHLRVALRRDEKIVP